MMGFLNVWQIISPLFHLSGLDWVIAFFLVPLTFTGHVLDLLQLAGKKYLEFVKWRVEYRRELARLKCEESRASGNRGGCGCATTPPRDGTADTEA